MNLERIPVDFHYLLKLVEKWGLPDDGYRDEQLFNAKESELLEIIESLPAEKLTKLNLWLETDAEDSVKCLTEEYVNFTCYFMAYEMARVLLKNSG